MAPVLEPLSRRPIRDLGLGIEGTPLAPLVAEAREELARLGLGQIKPSFYLSTEWGVSFGTVAVAIPFYLASAELSTLHAERDGHLEGDGPQDILRYLRHELGHVVNYAYRLYERPAWTLAFGTIEQPYDEDYRPVPFDRRFVRHLPGWYAQKHPDEDWAETFAVCVTPSHDWHAEYADHPVALAKLSYCAETLAGLVGKVPLVVDPTPDDDVGEIRTSIDDHYGPLAVSSTLARELEPLLRGVVVGLEEGGPLQPLSELVRTRERALMAEVYRWTGHFPERTRTLLRQMARAADEAGLAYPASAGSRAELSLASLLTALAMSFVRYGRYLP